MTTKTRPRVGDIAWHVDWTADIPTDENGDHDHDRADDRCERLPDECSAMIRARELIEKELDYYGSVLVTKVCFEAYDDNDAVRFPHAGFWDACCTSICVV